MIYKQSITIGFKCKGCRASNTTGHRKAWRPSNPYVPTFLIALMYTLAPYLPLLACWHNVLLQCDASGRHA